MKKIRKELYSLFDDIELTDDRNKLKKNKSYLIDFMNSIIELYNINIYEDSKYIDEEKIKKFLIDLGILNINQKVELLNKILGRDTKKFIYVINNYIEMNVEVDDLLKKYMDKYRKKEVEKYLLDDDSPTVVDFFCGAGGMSLGFRQKGYKIILANDIEPVCTETYSFNHCEIPKNRVITGDIKEIISNVEKFVSEKVDIIIGGPPCQGFSMANRQRIIDDPRNVLYKYYVKGVETLHPKFFIMENVKGMLSVAEQVIDDFHSLENVNYDVSCHLFNAKDFSVPQNRERLIYLGIRKDVSDKINKTSEEIIQEIITSLSKLDKFVLKDAILDLRELQALTIKNATELDTVESGKKIEINSAMNTKYVDLINMNKRIKLVFNHKARYNNDRDIEIFSRMLPGDKSDSERIKEIMPYKSRNNIFKDKYFKLKPDEVCKTITAHMKFDCNMYIHPFQARGLTPRESARIQSYPDDYIFLGSYTKTYMQIGNSVPPLMSRKIAEIIKQYI